MKKRQLVIVVAALLVMGGMVFAGGNSDKGTAAQAAPQVVNLKFNCVKPAADPQFIWYSQFFNDLTAATGGRLKTDNFPGESLGKAADVLEQAAQGEFIVAHVDAGFLANYVPDFAATMAPYLMLEPKDGLILWNTDVFKDLKRQLEAKGLHLIIMGYEGSRNLITKVPIKSRADVGSLKIRAAPAPMWNAVVQMLGGNPTNIAMSETYQALSQGVADGAEGIFGSMSSNKWFEVAKYVTRTDHLIGFTNIVMSSKIYDSLPADVKTTMDTLAFKYMEDFVAKADAVEMDLLAQMQKAGLQVATIDKAEFIAAAKNVPAAFPAWSPGIYDKLQNAIAAGRKK
jgi:TRAP-type C4-dicarboxylate transport system substrate-binding protein